MFVGDNRAYTKVNFVDRQRGTDARQAFDQVRKKIEEMKKKGETNNLPELPSKPEAWDPKGMVFDPEHPKNTSPNNTGVQDLPPAQPAFIYYPASASTRFPAVGSGGVLPWPDRCITTILRMPQRIGCPKSLITPSSFTNGPETGSLL
jgi:hypothetical protein